MNLIKFIEESLQNGGGSYNITTGEYNPADGYMVSLLGYEVVVDLNNFNHTIVDKYIKDNIEQLTDENNFIGIWIDRDEVYIDISTKMHNLKRACYVGIINDQKAIYDNEVGVAIHLPSPQRSGTDSQNRAYNEMKAEQLAHLIEGTSI